MRAIEASLAHPPILNEEGNADFCFQITEEVLDHVTSLTVDERKSEEFRILRKGLEYTISVFVANSPDEGFRFLRKWMQADDADLVQIMKSNLAKSRLAKKYSEEVLEVQSILWGNSA